MLLMTRGYRNIHMKKFGICLIKIFTTNRQIYCFQELEIQRTMFLLTGKNQLPMKILFESSTVVLSIYCNIMIDKFIAGFKQR